MNRAARLLILINWHERGRWYLYRRISKLFKSVRLMQPCFYTVCSCSWWRQVTIWLSEFYLPLCALFRRSSCDLIVSWSMRMGVWYGMLNRLFRSAKPPCHVIYDFHINPTRTDAAYRLRLMMLRAALPGIDFFLCTSRQEAQQYSTLFNILPSRITFFPMTPPHHYIRIAQQKTHDYILAYGNSDRDYDTLVRAVSVLPAKLIILSQRYRPTTLLPNHITILTKKTIGRELINLIVAARIVVLPLRDGAVAAGQTAMLETMALGRPLIVTDNPATREYAIHGESALFFTAGNAEQLREQIRLLLSNREFAETIGEKAREVSRHYPDRQVDEFCRVVAQVLH
ncbi:MAG: glycosyltransferase family 4 protein [Desulfobacterota bacterium]|nr:glycosyltransferase family 4 protein [Thermodesulfobacteriota bacterium]